MNPNLCIRSPFLISLMLFVMACSKKDAPVASSTPLIEYKSIKKIVKGSGSVQNKRDSVVLTIEFTDGDGNLGEVDSARIKQLFANQSWGNFQVRSFRLVNNQFEEFIIPSNAKLFVGLGGGNPSGKPLKGMLDYSQVFPYQGANKLVPVKFQVKIRDRVFNESNIIETDTIGLPITL